MPYFFLHRSRGHPGQLRDALDGVENRHLVADQLKCVTITRTDEHLVDAGLLDGLGGQGGQHVIGLEAIDLDIADAQCIEHLVQQ